MQSVVGSQFAVQPKGCRTTGTHVGFFAQMRTFVFDEIVALGEGAIAEWAFVGFFAGVGSHVAFDVVGVVESVGLVWIEFAY